ncbi:MAG: bifunctional folylpolyglutamate synthase/dihydrofolate synthase [Flavobacteriales bacterium]|nr:bifunctional folylpolyglutamate synthase/dihydrofolate synthase [Flavobacteriales bacterium]
MTYEEATAFLFTRLPMFQRTGPAAYKNDLSNTIALCSRLGNPERKFKSVHIAGTNGKGSTASAMASIFAEAGCKTGLFTSPHLKDFRERIRINGEMIPEAAVVDFLKKNPGIIDDLSPSFFELTCCMAFAYFAEEQVDIAVLETGMGGRLDSTNVVVPELSVITSIGYDHQQFLGNTLAAIAAEKGGIIKASVPVVVSENEPEVLAVLSEKAKAVGAPFTAVDPSDEGLDTDLGGDYQKENMRTVAAAVKVLREGGWKLSSAAVIAGASKVKINSGLRGRWEVISESPRAIADVGHNAEGVAMAVGMLKAETYRRLHIVWGMAADKDADEILSLLPADAIYYWCKPDVPRGKDAELLREQAEKFDLHGAVHGSVPDAYAAALATAESDDLVFVGGSVFVVGEIL